MRVILLAAIAASSAVCAVVQATTSLPIERRMHIHASLQIDGEPLGGGGVYLPGPKPIIIYDDEPVLRIATPPDHTGFAAGILGFGTPATNVHGIGGTVRVFEDHISFTISINEAPARPLLSRNVRVDYPDLWHEPITARSIEIMDAEHLIGWDYNPWLDEAEPIYETRPTLFLEDAVGPWHYPSEVIFNEVYAGHHYVLTLDDYGWVPRTTINGDMDGDGRVDQADLNAVLLTWGTEAPAWWTGIRPEGIIAQAELDQVLLNWGNVLVGPPQIVGTAAVPEPGTFLLMGVMGAMLCLLALNRRRR